MLRIDKLPNGLTVVTDTRSGTGSVALDIGLRAGPRFETPDIAGLSNLFGKMTTYGSNSRSRDQILQVIEGHGGSLNAVVESHGLHWIARILSRHLDESFAAIAEIMTDPKLDANDMESEKCNIAQQILNMEGVPRAKIGEKIRATAFTGQGMGNSLIGDATLLAGYTRKDLEAFRDSYLHASEMVVVAVGDVSHDRMMKLAAAGFGSMPNVAPRVFAPLIFTPGTYIEDDKDKQQINLRMAFKGPGREHPERFAATMFARIFGGDMVSPLFQEIRKKRSLAYGVRMLYNAFDGDGFYQFAAGIDRVKPGKSPPVAEAIPVFYRTLAEFLDGGMTQIQFTSAREKFHKELICNFHGTMASAGLYAGQILNEGRLISPDEFASCLGGLSMNHVYDVGLRMLADADKVAVAAIGPQDGMADTAGLASFAREAAIKAGAPGPVPGVRPKVPAKDTSSSADTPSEGMKTTVLSNGMKIVTYQIPGTGLVSSGFWVGAGSQDETAKENGAAHALEHMAFKGTPSWPSPGGIDRSVELDYAAYLNAYTSKDVTAYYNANVRPCDLPVLMKMFGEMTFKATVASEEFEGCDAQGKQVRKTAEKQVVVNEMNMYLDDASDQADNLMERTAYPRQPHGRPVIGTNKSLNPMTAAMLRGFRDRVYVPANTTLAVSGDITHDEVVAMAKKLFGHLPSGQVVHPKTPRFSPGMKTERRKRDLIELMIGFPGVDERSKDYIAQHTLAMILGQGLSSRLQDALLVKRQLVAGVGAYNGAYKNAGILQIGVSVMPENAKEVTKIICHTVRDLADTLTESEVTRVLELMENHVSTSFEAMDKVCRTIGHETATTGRSKTLDEMLAEIHALTIDDVRRLAKQVAVPPAIGAVGKVDHLHSYPEIAAMMQPPPASPNVKADAPQPN